MFSYISQLSRWGYYTVLVLINYANNDSAFAPHARATAVACESLTQAATHVLMDSPYSDGAISATIIPFFDIDPSGSD